MQTPNGIALDISLAALPFEEMMVGRAVDAAFFPGETLKVCSAEDLIVTKIFAGRPIDLKDAESIVTRQELLDWDYVESHLAMLDEIRGTSGLVEKAQDIRDMRRRNSSFT